MKKKILFFSFVTMLLIYAFPVSAVEWPPPVYDMPRVVIDTDSVGRAMSGFNLSVNSISSTGLKILGVCVVVVLISSIFLRMINVRLQLFQGVRRKEFGRKINALDRARNLDSIVDDRVGNMEVQLLAKNRFRLKHPHADLDEKIYQRELSYQAELEIRKRHPERAMEEAIYRKETGQKVNREFALRKNESKLFEKRMKDKK